MMNKDLRARLIEAAHADPSLRRVLVPVLRTGARYEVVQRGRYSVVVVPSGAGDVQVARDVVKAAKGSQRVVLAPKKGSRRPGDYARPGMGPEFMASPDPRYSYEWHSSRGQVEGFTSSTDARAVQALAVQFVRAWQTQRLRDRGRLS